MKYLIRFNESIENEKYFLGHEGGRGEYYKITKSDIEKGWDIYEEDDNDVALGDFLDSAEIGDRWILRPDSLTCVSKFSENINEQKLKEFSEEALMYLIDSGFKVEVSFDDRTDYSIILSKNNDFNWEDIKYDLIPFIELLNNKYTISTIYFSIFKQGIHSISVGTILKEDGFDKILLNKFNNSKIKNITIIVR
jgi:hypothetical protein